MTATTPALQLGAADHRSPPHHPLSHMASSSLTQSYHRSATRIRARPTSLCVVKVSVLRAYLSTVFLGLAALVLVVAGTPAKAALAGAGFALLGAALARTFDIAKERRAEAVLAAKERKADMEATRRAAYTVLHAGESRAPELVATLVTALTHRPLSIDPDLAARHVATLVDGRPGDRGESQAWLE